MCSLRGKTWQWKMGAERLGVELVDELLPHPHDLEHAVHVGRVDAVEVHGVGMRAAVLERNAYPIPLGRPQRRPRHLTVVGPRRVHDAGRHLYLGILRRHLVLPDGPAAFFALLAVVEGSQELRGVEAREVHVPLGPEAKVHVLHMFAGFGRVPFCPPHARILAMVLALMALRRARPQQGTRYAQSARDPGRLQEVPAGQAPSQFAHARPPCLHNAHIFFSCRQNNSAGWFCQVFRTAGCRESGRGIAARPANEPPWPMGCVVQSFGP
jgi:hypothetical protein